MLSPQRLWTKHENSKILIKAFEYFATFRSLYNILQDGFKQPSVRTLSAVT